jgi:DNA repair exonuclease SbcCD ATPase subunit
LIEAHGSRSAKLEESIGAKVAELEQLVDTQAQSFDTANHELQEIKRELGSMAERITGAELATQQNQTQAASDVEGAHERLVSLLTNESAALRAELIARLEQPLPASTTKRIEETFQERMDGLQRELEQKFVGRLDVEVQRLQDEMQNLTQRVVSLPTPSAPAVDFNSERSRWSKEVDERITATMQRFDDEIRDKFQTIDSVKAESERSIAETKAFAQQIAQDQQAMQQTTVGLSHELTAIKAGLIEQQNQQQTTEALLKSLKESVRTKLQEIEHYLVHGQNNLENRDAQFSEQKADLQRIAQRIAEVEAMAHQTHALMVNENEQAAQLRDGFRMDLATLQRRLSEQQSMEAVIQGVEDGLTVKLRELQNQLAQKMLLVDRRDAEFRELKAQVQILAQGIASTGTTPPPGQSPAANRIKETAVLAADIGALTPKPEDRLSVASSKIESIPPTTHGLHHEDAEPGDRLLDDAKNQLTQLQERMSADIERARAELREKSGRWKVRR